MSSGDPGVVLDRCDLIVSAAEIPTVGRALVWFVANEAWTRSACHRLQESSRDRVTASSRYGVRGGRELVLSPTDDSSR
jgi:hypothetical protein